MLPSFGAFPPSLSAFMAGPLYGAALQAAAAASGSSSPKFQPQSWPPPPGASPGSPTSVPFGVSNPKSPLSGFSIHESLAAQSKSSPAVVAVAAAAAAALTQSSSPSAAAFHSELIKAASRFYPKE